MKIQWSAFKSDKFSIQSNKGSPQGFTKTVCTHQPFTTGSKPSFRRLEHDQAKVDYFGSQQAIAFSRTDQINFVVATLCGGFRKVVLVQLGICLHIAKRSLKVEQQ